MRKGLHDWWDSTDDPYERMETMAQYITKRNPEATFYDLFNFVREEVFLGLPYDEEDDFIRSIDFDIDYEYRRTVRGS
jgi:hypothetical protein